MFAPVANLRVIRICGAIYEVTEIKDPSRDQRPFRPVLWDRELFAWDEDKIGHLHLF